LYVGVSERVANWSIIMQNLVKVGVVAAIVFGLSFVPTPSNANEAKIMNRVCTPTAVSVYSNRIHVKCKPIQGKAYTNDITYYAMAISSRNSKRVDYTLQVLLAAKTSKRNLRLWFDYDDYESVPGCKGVNCRKLTGVSIR
jgi:hypothetical protein